MSTDSSRQHKDAAAERGPVTIAIVTVSDTRTPETDANGAWLREQIADADHALAEYRVIPDDPDRVRSTAEELAGRARIVLFNGGTGISHRDNTYDAIAGLLEKTLPGFGELFRMLSWEQVGSAAMLSRAVAGVYRDTVLFSTPGSTAAVQLAWDRLIRPELKHLAWELGR